MHVGNVFKAKKFDTCKILSKKFHVYSKIVFRDAGNFFRHQAELVLRHPMRMSNNFVNFFYSDTVYTQAYKILVSTF